jgi:cysteine desulfurase/selenocysteine lyase
MFKESPELLENVRDKFAHIEICPFEGPRIFFENAGGALTLKSVIETSAKFAAIPDNQARDNPASHALVAIINKAKADMRVLFNAPEGQFFVGESGTELLFRLIRNAIVGPPSGGHVLGSSLEHPASRSAARHWAEFSNLSYINVQHNSATGSVEGEDYAALITPDTRVATILHTSPVTGMGVDVVAVSKAIRAVAPNCFIIVDGIQHAAHGLLDIDSYDVDGYVISPYKMFSRHGYGVAWVSGRLTDRTHEMLRDGPESAWELGTRDTGAYATMSDVVTYLDWLGTEVSDSDDQRTRLVAAGTAIKAHEKTLTDAMLYGKDNLKGVSELDGVEIVGGIDNHRREGLVSLRLKGMASADLVTALRRHHIRAHVRKDDHYSGNILTPMGWTDCVRISLCHYNSLAEVTTLLTAFEEIIKSNQKLQVGA